jgi:septum formation protein
MHMGKRIILASGSAARRDMLRNSGVTFEVEVPRVDEDAIKSSLLAEEAKPRDVADTLAEYKARRVASKQTDALVIGSDQVLGFEGAILSKPVSPEQAAEQLRAMSGKKHVLLSAAVIYEDAKPVWRSIGTATLFMRNLSQSYIDDYVTRNWDDIRHCVGGYQLEAEGARLFSRVDGDYFTVLGMPLLDVLGYLTTKGVIDG